MDFKDGCDHAARELVDFARDHTLEITLIYSFDQSYFEEKSHLYPDAISKLESAKSHYHLKFEEELKTWAKKRFDGLDYKVRVEFGRPSDIVASLAADYDWLVIGMNQHNLLENIFSTSTAEELLGRTQIPTLVLRDRLAGSMMATVLLDLGDKPLELVKASSLWAQDVGIKHLCFQVYYPMPLQVPDFMFQAAEFYASTDFQGLLGDIMESTKKTITNITSDLDITVKVQKVAAASVVSDIGDEMEKHEGPVIVGRKHRSNASKFFLGSVTTTLLRRGNFDLVILPLKN